MGQLNTLRTPDVDTTLAEVISYLKAFCRGEMSAVETYRQAIEATSNERLLLQLRRNLASHESRVRLLSKRITELGGEPPDGSGPWGALANIAEGAAGAIGVKAALSMLEEGEDHGLRDYRGDLSRLDLVSQRLVEDQILPQQVLTRRVVEDAKRSLS